MTIYFDKLTGQNTCVSFRIIQEYFVDHLKPANVKLYDYYQQELTVSTVSSDDFYSILIRKKKNVTIDRINAFRITQSLQFVAARNQSMNKQRQINYLL